MSKNHLRKEVGNSWTAMGDWMWEEHKNHRITNTELIIYMRLASFDRALAEKLGYRDVTIKRLRAGLGITKGTINNAIKSLEEKGWVKRKKLYTDEGWCKCTRYWLYEPKTIIQQMDEDKEYEVEDDS